MLPLLGGLISGGASLLGNIFSSDTSAANTQANIAAQQQAQAQSEQFNAAEAAKNRDFQANQVMGAEAYSTQQADINRGFQADQVAAQEQYQTQMSNTAYQRAVQDMQKAGINPMLAYMQGGASVPSGSAAVGSSPTGFTASGSTASIGTPNMALSARTSPFANLGDVVAKGVNSAISMKTMDRLTEEIANLQAERGLTEARVESEKRVPALTTAKTASEEAQPGYTRQLERESKAGTRLKTLQEPQEATKAAKAESDLELLQNPVTRKILQGAQIGKAADDIISPFISGAQQLNWYNAIRR